MLLSRLLERPSLVNTPLCPAARPTSSTVLQGPDLTDQYGRRRELTKPQWPLTSDMAMFTGPFHRACSAGRNESQWENDCRKWRDLGKGSSGETQAGFYSGYPMPALRFPATWVATSTCLKNPTTHFWSYKTSVCQFFLVNPIILKLVWFESRQQEDTEFNKPSRPKRSVQYVFLHDI